MSSGKWSRHDGFNPMQIKDGWIVRIGKDGKIREKIEPVAKAKKPNVRVSS